MRGYNRVILAGNLTRDPQLKYLPNQTAVVEFAIAVSRKWRTPEGTEREEVCFVDCAAFGKQGEAINQYCTKGKPLLVEGRLKFDQWEDKQGGGKRSKHSVVVENFTLLGGPGGGGPGGESGVDYSGVPEATPRSAAPAARSGYRQPAPQTGSPADSGPSQAPAEPPFSNDQQFKDDDIPF